MKAIGWAVLLAMISPFLAYGQSYSGQGYAYYSADVPDNGTWGDLMSVGGGGEAFLWKGLTVGAELGYLFPREYAQSGVGVLSVDGGWHFVNRERPGRVVPFLNGGYTLGFRSGVLNLVNVGGGVAWWFTKRLALRTEVRTYVYTGGGRFDTSIRFGIQFR